MKDFSRLPLAILEERVMMRGMFKRKEYRIIQKAPKKSLKNSMKMLFKDRKRSHKRDQMKGNLPIVVTP